MKFIIISKQIKIYITYKVSKIFWKYFDVYYCRKNIFYFLHQIKKLRYDKDVPKLYKMKKIFLLLFLITYSVQGQVGIGTDTPNASARLDVSATDKGFLPPRISLTSATDNSTILTPATGLLIYNTATAGTIPNNVSPGYYYWNGNSWVKISGGTILDNSKSSSFTLTASDNNKLFIISASSAVTVTVPSNLPLGFNCQIIQGSSGLITISGASGVTLNGANGLKTRSMNSIIGLTMISSTLGYVYGDTMY